MNAASGNVSNAANAATERCDQREVIRAAAMRVKRGPPDNPAALFFCALRKAETVRQAQQL